MKTIAVVVSAYKCKDYIIECINSIKKQEMPEGWEIDLRIGVDGCKETCEVLKENKIPFYYGDENVGTYIMRNSLIYLKKADLYCYFDADDVMLPNYFNLTVRRVRTKKLVMPKKINVDVNLRRVVDDIIDEGRGGSMVFDNDILNLLGGYKEYRVSCDCDFVLRSRKAGFERALTTDRLYLRRRHGDALTVNEATNLFSEYRKRVVSEMNAQRKTGEIKIIPKTIDLKHYSP